MKTRFDVEDLADRIATAAIAATFRRERGTHEAKGAWRPTFAIEVTPQLFDRFFNNPCGYRGHYLASPDLGVSANLNLLKTIAPRLLTVAPNSAPGRQHIEESLASPAAKIWIDEDQHDPRNPELRVQVQVPTWVAAATAAHARLQSADPTLTPKEIDRIFGVRAPNGTRLKVFGAWVGVEGVQPAIQSKQKRALEIHAFGVS